MVSQVKIDYDGRSHLVGKTRLGYLAPLCEPFRELSSAVRDGKTSREFPTCLWCAVGTQVWPEKT